MHKFLLAALLLAALVSTGFSSVPSAAASPLATFSDAAIAETLAAHNAVRQRVAQAESQRLGGTVVMPALTWNAEVAAVAQNWADQQAVLLQQGLRPQHRSNNIYGENMYWAWNSPDLSPTPAVQAWANEQQYYHYDTNTCSAPPQKYCTHYTQLVWSATTQVGCGQAVGTAADGRRYVLWVCNYAPAGNINIEVQRPYSVTATAPAPSCARQWAGTLRYGDVGGQVVILQLRLSDVGETVRLTGTFDDQTELAVRHFQAVHGLTVDGVFGPQTQAVLNTICPHLVLRLGKRH